MKTIQPPFPVTLDDLRSNPAMVEHWPQVARVFTGFLLTNLQASALAAQCGDNAAAEAGASRAIALLLQQVLTLGNAADPPKPPVAMRPLHRFTEEKPNPEKTTE